jgi:hypothetical protein
MIGYQHQWIEEAQNSKTGPRYLRVRFERFFRFARLGKPAAFLTQAGTIETPAGEILRFEYRETIDGEPHGRVHADLIKGRFILKTDDQPGDEGSELRLGPDVRGPAGVEQSLERRPMRPGELRTDKELDLETRSIVLLKLVAKGLEKVE